VIKCEGCPAVARSAKADYLRFVARVLNPPTCSSLDPHGRILLSAVIYGSFEVVARSLAIGIILTLFSIAACGGGSEGEGQQPMAESGISTLQRNDVKVGTGAEARKGQTVRVHYTGWLYDTNAADHKGLKFDSSRDRNDPIEFRLGAGEVIPGWDEGLPGMKVGGTRVLTIPPAMGYGASGAGGVIPPNATLIFEVELLDVR
jgi:hypothetical protein